MSSPKRAGDPPFGTIGRPGGRGRQEGAQLAALHDGTDQSVERTAPALDSRARWRDSSANARIAVDEYVTCWHCGAKHEG